VSENGFVEGEERTLDLGALKSSEDIALYACINDAITRRTGEGAPELKAA